MTDNATAKKITRTRPTKYPVQAVYMLDEGLANGIAHDAEIEGVSKSEIARRYLAAGRAVEAYETH